MQNFWFNFTPVKNLSINAGYAATLATEQRPHPLTGDGQFETFSEAQISGGAYNIKIVANNLGKFGFGACIAYRDNGMEYQGMLKYDWLKVSAWYDSNQKVGSAITMNLSRVYNVTSWRQDEVIANILCIKLGKDKDYVVYSDNGYDLNTKQIVRAETGFLKNFSSSYIKGLFGLGYKYET